MMLLACFAGCTSNQASLRIDHAIDPMPAVPANRFVDWRPSPSDKTLINPDPSTGIRPNTPGQALFDPNKTYAVGELVDLGLRSNPVTRSAWEDARAAAAALGIAEAAWLPIVTAQIDGGYWRYPFPSPGSAFSLEGTLVDPVFNLSWTLFDLSRPAKIDMAMQQLFATNLALNRNHQEVIYKVQTAFYGFVAAKTRVEAAETTLRQATRNRDAIQAQLELGLATQPEYLLAVQDQAKAGYELQGARGAVMEKDAELAEQLALPPGSPLKTVTLGQIDLPKDTELTADALIDAALEDRPDLTAKLADIRARDAEIRKAEANYWPVVGLQADGGWKVWSYSNAGGTDANQGSQPVKISSPLVDAYLTVEWNFFEGFATNNAVRRAEAKRNAAEAEFDALKLKVMKEIWKAYADLKTAARKREFAVAMLRAAEAGYESGLKSYEQGVATVIELLTAERNLAQARYTEIDSRSSLLTAAASLAFAAGGGHAIEQDAMSPDALR